MAAIYEYTGVIEKVLDTQTFPSGFSKRDVVLTDDVGEQTKYPNHITFTFKKDAANVLETVKEGQRVKIRFAIDGRVWNDPKTGKDRYFTDLTGLKLEVIVPEGETATEPEPVVEMPGPNDDTGYVDDMPF